MNIKRINELAPTHFSILMMDKHQVKDVIKSIPSSFKQKRKQKNVFNFFRFAIILALFVVIYMNIFKHLMSEERGVSGISWVESFYWGSDNYVDSGLW